MKRLIVLLAGILISYGVLADWLPRQDLVPGGIAWVDLGPADRATPRAFLGTDRVLVARQGNRWLAVVGLPLNLPPGKHTLTILDHEDRLSTREFDVQPKEYAAQRITIKNKRMVEPNPDDLERILREQDVMTQIFTQWTEPRSPLLAFQLPARGRLTGNFGLRRFFNEQERQPHSGVDIAAARGTPVVAPADGVVVEVGDYFFNGQTVFIDHGYGLVSMYNHLDRITVRVGEKVTRGQRIGAVGMTGRATGPHLHWAISLNNTRIDPLLFVPQDALRPTLSQAK